MSLVAEIFERAAAIIERDGWAQGHAFAVEAGEAGDDSCAVCVYGAIARAAGMRRVKGYDDFHFLAEQTSGFIAAMRAIEKYVSDSIGEWNDAPGRTKEEVVAALREAAKAAS